MTGSSPSLTCPVSPLPSGKPPTACWPASATKAAPTTYPWCLSRMLTGFSDQFVLFRFRQIWKRSAGLCLRSAAQSVH